MTEQSRMRAMDNRSKALFTAGAVLVTVASVLSAAVEGIAYATQWVNTFGPLSIEAVYHPLTLGTHPATWIFVVCTFGGLLGVAYSAAAKRALLAFASIFFTGLGLFMPIYVMQIAAPEAHYFDLPWMGSYLILAGLCLMTTGVLTEKTRIRQATLTIVAALLALFAVYPAFILTNSSPYLAPEAIGVSVYSIVGVCTFACYVALLTLLALSNKSRLMGWIKEKEGKDGFRFLSR